MPGKTCKVCGERTAIYVCQNCGSSICPVCRVGWSFKKCAADETSTVTQPSASLKPWAMPLLIVAIFTIIAGFVLVFLGSNIGSSSSGCFVWPLPLIVGCGVGSGGTLVAWLFLPFFVALIGFWLLTMRRSGPELESD